MHYEKTIYYFRYNCFSFLKAGSFQNVFKIRKESEGVRFFQYYATAVGLILEEGIRESGKTFTFRELVSYQVK